MSNLQISTFEANHSTGHLYDAVTLLTREVEFKYEGEPTNEYIERSVALSRDRNFLYHVLTDASGDLVGAAETEHALDEDGPITQVWQLAVEPEHRGRGYGRALVQSVAKIALQRGDVQIYLDSTEDDFYLRLGFKRFETGDPDDMMLFATPAAVLSA